MNYAELIQNLIKSKRVQGFIVAALLVIFKDKLNIPITEEQLTYIVGLVVALILGDSLRPVVPPAPVVDADPKVEPKVAPNAKK